MHITLTSITLNKDGFTLSTDPARLDLEVIHSFLRNCYWAKGIPRETVARSIENSLCFGVYEGSSQVGFARVISDFATYAYIGDVFILESHRGRGLSQWMTGVHHEPSQIAKSPPLDFAHS
jgi:hypothetical protein